MRTALILLGLVGSLVFAARGPLGLADGPRSPAQTTYYGNGGLRSSVQYADGLRHGPAGEWHPDGRKASEGAYAAGLREGPWTFWRADGSVDAARSGVYRGGERVGPLAGAQLIADS